VFDEEQLAVMGVVYTTRYLDQGIVACDDIYFKAMQQCKDARATKDQSRLASIRNILMLGKKLRTDEMDYLQRHHPHLHDQAMPTQASGWVVNLLY
jgi:hypothetical protein